MKIKESNKNMEPNSYLQKIYTQIILLVSVFHFGYIILYVLINQPQLAWFNVCSVIVYISLLKVIKLNRLRETLFCVHLEVCIFVTLGVLMLGWEFGFQYLLACVVSVIYFNPYKNKLSSYVIAVSEMLIFVLLYLYTRKYMPWITTNLSVKEISLIFLVNAVSSFALILYVAYVSNVSQYLSNFELREQNKNLQDLADNDPLTGLLNRRGMQAKMEKIFLECQVSSTNFAIIIGDIDDFKNINDTYGHDCGDYVLRSLADIFKFSLREKDYVSRWGGEEFLILLYNVDDESTFDIIDRLRKNIQKTKLTYKNKILNYTVSFGGFVHKENYSIDEMIKKADESLYFSKKHGKNQTKIS